MMKSILSLLGALAMSSVALGALTDFDRAELEAVNRLGNPGFEAGRARWTVNAGTATIDTTGQFSGQRALSISLSAVNGDVLTQSVTPSAPLGGVALESSMRVKTTSSNVQVCALQAGVEISCSSVPPTGNWFPIVINHIGAASGTIGVKLKTTSSTTATVGVDDGYVGAARNLGNVAQATWFGGASMVGIVNCQYTTTSTTFATFAADADCNNSTGSGSIAAPSTKQIGFSGTLPAGIYLIQANLNNLDSAASAHGFRLIAGATTSSEFRYSFRDATTSSYQATATFILTLTSTYTGDVFLQGLTNGGGGTLSIVNNSVQLRLGFDVFRFPSTPEVAVRSDILPASWSGSQTVSGGWSVTSTTYADVSAGTSVVTTQINNRNFGTVATATGSLPGLLVSFPRVGFYEICAAGNFQTSGSAVTGSLRLVDGATTVFFAGQSYVSTTASTQVPFEFCGIYNATSLAATIVKVQAAVNSGSITIANGTATGTPAVSWSIKALDAAVGSPILVGAVSTASTGQLRHEFVSFGGPSEPSACTAASCTIYRTSAGATVSRASAGRYTLTWPVGTFSATPACLGSTGAATQGFPLFDGVSATSYTLNFNNSASGAADTNMNIVCTGPR